MFGKAWEDSEDEHLSVIRSGGLGDVGLHIVGLKLDSVVDLLADLLGEGQLDGGAGGGGDHGDALLNNSDSLLDLGDGDASLRDDILAGDDGEVDGLVDADLLGLGVGNGDGGLNRGDDGDVVASLLGDLLAVVVAVAVVSVSGGGLAHGHHLDVALLVEGDLDGLGGGLLGLLGVLVHADLVVDHLGGLGADGGGDGVAHLDIDDLLDGQLHISTLGGEGGGADLSGLDNINNAAVVLGGLVGIGGGVVDGVVNSVNRGVVNSVDRGVVSNDGGGVVDGVDGGVMNSVGHGGVDSVSHNRGGVRGVMSNTVTGASEVGEGGEGNISLGGGKSQGEEGQAESLQIGEKYKNLLNSFPLLLGV